MSISPDTIRKVAEAYAEAWCSGSGVKVASFYSENATSIVNGGVPTVGRAAIAEAVDAFMTEFSDMVLHVDELRTAGDQAVHLWTIEGTHGTTGNVIQIRGWQNWVLSEDLLIVEANGGYDAAEYDRQVEEGA